MLKNKRKRADIALAETLGWDYRDVSECRYQKYVSPAVYAIGDNYFAVHASRPKHVVGTEWREHSDQFGVRGSNKKIWVCGVLHEVICG